MRLSVPPGTFENSPPIHRWVHGARERRSPIGAKDFSRAWLLEPSKLMRLVGVSPLSRFDGSLSRLVGNLCRPCRDRHVLVSVIPPLKRWAVFNRPCRDQQGSETQLYVRGIIGSLREERQHIREQRVECMQRLLMLGRKRGRSRQRGPLDRGGIERSRLTSSHAL